MPVSTMDILLNSTSHLEKATCHPPKPTLSCRPLKRQKSPTLAYNVEKQLIGRNGVQKPISQTKMTTEGNSICFSGHNDLSTIPPTFTEILENKNYECKSEQKHISIKGKLKEKYEFWQNTIKANETILQILDEGYMLPFIETPSDANFQIINPL